MVKPRPRGREEVVDALLASARKLIAERGPGVALRDIADDAGVNFGLLYHYLGTKDELVDGVYRAAAESYAQRFAHADHLHEALELLLRNGDGTTARLIGRAVLEGRGASPAFRDSPALAVLVDLMRKDAVEAGVDVSDDDARLFAAFVMTMVLGWRLFGETALLAAGADDTTPERHGEQILDLVRQLAAVATTTRG